MTATKDGGPMGPSLRRAVSSIKSKAPVSSSIGSVRSLRHRAHPEPRTSFVSHARDGPAPGAPGRDADPADPAASPSRRSEVGPALDEARAGGPLRLDHQSWRALPTEVEGFLRSAEGRRVRELSLAGGHLTEVPGCLAGLSSLEALSLDSNDLADVPDWLGGLSRLTRLVLSRNSLRALPDSLSRCSRLVRIEASHNQVRPRPGGPAAPRGRPPATVPRRPATLSPPPPHPGETPRSSSRCRRPWGS